jgi:hypothetical protein
VKWLCEEQPAKLKMLKHDDDDDDDNDDNNKKNMCKLI